MSAATPILASELPDILTPGDLVAIRSINTMADEGLIGRIVIIDDDEISAIHEGAWYADSVFPAYGDVWTLPWCWISSVSRVTADTLQVVS